MRIINFRFRSIWVMLLSVLIAAQCDVFGSSGAPTAAPPVELTYVSFVDDGDSNNAEMHLIAQFEAAHPDITISRGQYAGSLQTYLTDASPPDLMVVIADENTFSAIEAGLALNISNVWGDAHLAEAYPTGFRNLGAREGRQYFLPIAYTWTAIYYNQQLFSNYGLAPPETWDEFLAVADTLWLNEITPLALARNDDWSVSMWFDYLSLRLYGPEFYDQLVQGKISYTDFRVRDVFETWRILLEDGYFGDSLAPGGLVRNFDRVIKGEAGMILSSPVLMQALPEAWFDQFAFFSFPIVNPDLPVTESVPSFGYLVPAGTAHPAETAEFLTFMSSAEAQNAFTQQLGANFGIAPIHNGVDTAQFGPMIEQGSTLVRAAEAIVRPSIFASPEAMNQKAASTFRQFLRNPENVDEVLESLEEARLELFGG